MTDVLPAKPATMRRVRVGSRLLGPLPPFWDSLRFAAAAAILAIGVGAAIAGGGLFQTQDAFLNDVAKRLNVTPAELKAAHGEGSTMNDVFIASIERAEEEGQ